MRPAHSESWDEKMVERLRSQGYAPFNQYPVDFFLAMPDEAACGAVRARLEQEGFTVDVRPIEDDATLPLEPARHQGDAPDPGRHGRASQRFSALAAEFQGRYDGWAA